MDQARAIERVERAEMESYIALYTAATEHGCGWLEIDGIHVVWSGGDEDPGFSAVLNLADAPDPGVMLSTLEDAARERGAKMIGIDTPPALADWATAQELESRGYIADYDEYIVAIETHAFAGTELPEGVRISLVTDPAEIDLFARTLNIGYEVPAEHPRGYVFGSTIGQPNWSHYLAWVDDQPASASVLFITEGVGDLFVTTTVPHLRGRGAQNAMITARLRDARDAGCDIATSQVITSNASPRNMFRRGFESLYQRSIWGKPLR